MSRKTVRRRAERGFTLIELLVVVVILGLLATVVMQNLLPETDNARVETVRSQMSIFNEAVKRYTIRHNVPPESFDDLIQPDEKNGNEPWIETDKIPADPWGSEYRLEPHPERRNRVLISSAGPNRTFDDEDDITTDNLSSYQLPSSN